jgi:hypothetical protein
MQDFIKRFERDPDGTWMRPAMGERPMDRPTWPERYYLGLENIKTAIETALTEAGAKVGHDSIFHPRLPPAGLDLPRQLTITVVPLNGPRIATEFGRDEIVAFCDGGKEETLARIGAYVEAYKKFRDGPERHLRA